MNIHNKDAVKGLSRFDKVIQEAKKAIEMKSADEYDQEPFKAAMEAYNKEFI